MLNSPKNTSEMATGEQIKALIKSHFDNENERFITLSLQIAANKARSGQTTLADDIKKIIDRSKSASPKLKILSSEFQSLVLEVEPLERINDLIVSYGLKDRIKKVLREYIQRDKLARHGLTNRRKILLTGPPGTGKTMTASVIAKELNMPLYFVLMDKMVTKFMGETSAKLRQIFDTISENQGVYLFDEFDAIGGERSKDNDVGEMRRVLNSFLQFIERDSSQSIIVAATNNLNLLDQALFRRFDDVMHYSLPTKEEVIELLQNRLGSYKGSYKLDPIATLCQGLSHAEITQACADAIKDAILDDKNKVDKSTLEKTIKDRTFAYREHI
jgi:SpoVK/Ycf46/Vps4 family AAA+-type ATPase